MTAARHRRPASRSPRTGGFALAAVITGATPVAISALTPAVAEASTENWDRIADCESSGNWHTQTGNGFGGGLQFTDSTWHAYGGSGQPENASREQQIAVAERVKVGQGMQAWPVCGKRGGGVASSTQSTTPAPRHRTPTTAPRVSRPAPSGTAAPARPRVTDQPRAVQQAVAASGPTNPACQSLHQRGVPVRQLDALNRAHPELGLDGNRNGIPCEITYPRGGSAPARIATPARIAPAAAVSTARHSSVAATVSGNGLIGTARTWIGAPYLYGGETRAGVDCSGLVQRVFAANGISLPRTADAQMRATQRISLAQARPGDLVFGVTGGVAHHVGVYLGNGQMIDAPSSGGTVGVHRLYRDMTVFGRVR